MPIVMHADAVTVIADWSWFTYFLVGGEVITRGRIVDYDRQGRRLRFLVPTGRSDADNPHPLGSDEYQAWLYRVADAGYEQVWVDPERKIVLSPADFARVERGEKPDGFVVLDDRDPREYFAGEQIALATYLPKLE